MERGRKAAKPAVGLQDWRVIKEQMGVFGMLLGANGQTGEVDKAVGDVVEKMRNVVMADMHPPFLPKTLTKYRHEHYLPLKKLIDSKVNSQEQAVFEQGIRTLAAFVRQLDEAHFDTYLEQTRSPYIRKMFSENYEFDKVDFKEINAEYKVRTEIEDVLNEASEWLIQIERTGDLLARVELYFGIKAPVIMETVKSQGFNGKMTWGESFMSMVRKVSSFSLRKGSKAIQTSLFTSVAPAAAMLTLAIIGGSASLPWKSDLDPKLLLAPLTAVVVPYCLDSLATSLQRSEVMHMLHDYAVALEKVSSSIAKFNDEIEGTISRCCQAETPEDFAKERLNLEKYVKSLNQSVSAVTRFDEEKFEEMRERTEAYFARYSESKEGEWIVVLPDES